MGNYTTNLSLYNTDMTTDGNDTFDFQRDLNDNNDKIDSAFGNLANLTTTQKANLVSAINEIVSNLDGKTSKSLNDLNAVGQAILDKKVEVEALLAQNGYAKFSWKENNEISILLCWGVGRTSDTKNAIFKSFARTYTNNVVVSISSIDNDNSGFGINIHGKTISGFYPHCHDTINNKFYAQNFNYFAIGD
jgi:hypothetical protein